MAFGVIFFTLFAGVPFRFLLPRTPNRGACRAPTVALGVPLSLGASPVGAWGPPQCFELADEQEKMILSAVLPFNFSPDYSWWL